MAMTFTDANFQTEVLDFKGLVVVDFWATWCGPCRIQGPIIDSLAQKYTDNPGVKIGKLDVDENEIAAKYQILSIPTLLFFKNGEIVESVVGLRSEQELEDKIKYYLSAN